MLKFARYGPWVLGFLTVVALFLSGRASCSNREMIPYLGKWTGGFTVVELPGGSDNAAAKKRSSLYGYVMIYAMAQSFKMHLEGAQEVIDLDGKWTRQGRRLTLTTTGIKIDDEGGVASRDPNLPFIPSDQIHAAYARRLVLDMTLDRHRLLGLEMSLGGMLGRHEFERD